MKITIDGHDVKCVECKITTTMDANPKINLTALRLQSEPHLIKSGFIVNCDVDSKVESKSGLTRIEFLKDPFTSEIRIKLRFWGEHPQLHRVPAGQPYPKLSLAEVVEIIDDYLQKGSTSTHEV